MTAKVRKWLSALIILAGVTLLKAKGMVILFIEKVRAFLVNPFEGFSAIQYAVAGGSFAVTIAAYATQAPLAVVVGFVVITLIHEIGHAVAIRAKGLRAGYMVFIPFIGGAVTLRDQPRTAYDDAQIGLAGPIFGTAASLVCLQIYKWLADPIWLFVAAMGFVINLFNLIPLGLLDGGRISAAITKWMWVLGGGVILYHIVRKPNPLTILIGILAAFQVYFSLVREKTDVHYYELDVGRRALVALVYFGLVIFLGHQTWMALERLEMLRGQG